ncbi:MAG: S41 family peptidase [Planctomycetota bacterium]
MTRRQFLLLILPLLLVLLGFVALHVVERVAGFGAPAWDADFTDHMLRQMEHDYVFGLGDEERQQAAYFAALNAYLQSYDPFAEVVPPQAVDAAEESSTGQYFGIGIRMAPEELLREDAADGMEIKGVAPDGPAARAGLLVGERIMGVDGRSIETIVAEEEVTGISAAIRGEKGTDVRLNVQGLDGNVRAVDVERDAVTSGSVFGARFVDEPRRIGYVRVQSFHQDTTRDLRGYLDKLLKKGMQSLVLDLRGNRGGLLQQAVSIADLFVPRDNALGDPTLVRQDGRTAGFSRVAYATVDGTLIPDLPMIVLVDRGSASASEILAGALQDHRRALIVGERTYGKFLVQQMTPERTRFGPVLFKRTCAVYTTPRGRSYPHRAEWKDRERRDPLAGIPPDHVVTHTPNERLQMARVFTDEAFRDWNPDYVAEREPFVDRQLAAAVDLLSGAKSAPLMPGAAQTG